MKMNNFDKRLGKEIFSFVLVGTMMTSVAVATNVSASEVRDGRSSYANEFSLGHYTDEDVKANRARVFASISTGGSKKAKTYSKKKDNIVVPKPIVR